MFSNEGRMKQTKISAVSPLMGEADDRKRCMRYGDPISSQKTSVEYCEILSLEVQVECTTYIEFVFIWPIFAPKWYEVLKFRQVWVK